MVVMTNINIITHNINSKHFIQPVMLIEFNMWLVILESIPFLKLVEFRYSGHKLQVTKLIEQFRYSGLKLQVTKLIEQFIK